MPCRPLAGSPEGQAHLTEPHHLLRNALLGLPEVYSAQLGVGQEAPLPQHAQDVIAGDFQHGPADVLGDDLIHDEKHLRSTSKTPQAAGARGARGAARLSSLSSSSSAPASRPANRRPPFEAPNQTPRRARAGQCQRAPLRARPLPAGRAEAASGRELRWGRRRGAVLGGSALGSGVSAGGRFRGDRLRGEAPL